MPSWPTERRVLGTRVPRLEGPQKVSGRAKYAYDINLPGLCHAVLLQSPHGHCRVTSIDTARAERLPGVRAVRVLRGPGSVLQYHGDEVAVAVADSEAQARDAVAAIAVDYEVLTPVVYEDDAMKPDAPRLHDEGNFRRGDPRRQGDTAAAFAAAAASFEGTFSYGVQTHSCLEAHGAVAQVVDGKVTVWSSTQSVSSVREALVRSLRVAPADVEVIVEHMGGGFGGKLGLDREAAYAAELARDIGRPVKLMRDREGEQTDTGCRESNTARLRLACDANGRLTAVAGEGYGTGGVGGRAGLRVPYIYGCPNVDYQHTDVFVNANSVRAMRAPGCPGASFIMESAVEGMAEAAGIDPLEFRKRNLGGGYVTQLDLGAQAIGWQNRRPTSAAAAEPGPLKRGFGCAVAQWGGSGHDSNARLAIHPNGQIEIWCATQDLGTGTRTALAIVVAETFGLQPQEVTVHIGHGSYPPSGGSGGSTTIGGVASAARTVGEQALERFLATVAPHLETEPGNLQIVPGAVQVRGNADRRLTWAQACATLGANPITAEAPRDGGLTAGGVGGAQFAEVEVDTETGVVRVLHMVAVQDCGLVVNRLTCESQVIGGVTMGIGLALFEERVMDRPSGRMLNPNLEFYKLPGASDIPPITCLLQDMPERGVIGVGEPPAIPTASAIANAVFNAIGVQVTSLPLTPDKVLAALGETV